MLHPIPEHDPTWPAESCELWQTVHSKYALDEHHTVLLRQACHLLSRAKIAREEIAQYGMFVTDRAGMRKPSPAVKVEQNSINQLRLTLRELGLDFEGGAALTSKQERVRMPRAVGYQ